MPWDTRNRLLSAIFMLFTTSVWPRSSYCWIRSFRFHAIIYPLSEPVKSMSSSWLNSMHRIAKLWPSIVYSSFSVSPLRAYTIVFWPTVKRRLRFPENAIRIVPLSSLGTFAKHSLVAMSHFTTYSLIPQEKMNFSHFETHKCAGLAAWTPVKAYSSSRVSISKQRTVLSSPAMKKCVEVAVTAKMVPPPAFLDYNCSPVTASNFLMLPFP